MALDLARLQFGVTTVYHFFFVPITIGMGFLLAGFETAWVRTGHERWKALTKFYGKLFLVNVAIGVVTGIWQEFQFGMSWSAYSVFVGNIFGAPLAIEALLAFFLEATFIGLWIFGWDRLKPWVHCATIWIVAIGGMLSAYFILAANSWMQHPVGFRINPVTHQATLTSFLAVITNPLTLVTFPHIMASAFLTGGGVIFGVAAWRLMRQPAAAPAAEASVAATDVAGQARGRKQAAKDEADPRLAPAATPHEQASVAGSPTAAETAVAFRAAAKVSGITMLVAAAALGITGDTLAKVMTLYQPMKMAAAEALWHTSQPASFSIFTIGTLNGSRPIFQIRIPYLLSFLATANFKGKVDGIDNIQAVYQRIYGPGSYAPIVPVTYWGFRLMIGLGMLAALLALVGLWFMRGGRQPQWWWLRWLMLLVPLLPLGANSAGWIFTEMGRQPWIVFGQMKTSAGVSATAAGAVLGSVIVLSLLYLILGVIVVRLMIKEARTELPVDPPHDDAEDKPLSFAY